jgi:hypothetical protein
MAIAKKIHTVRYRSSRGNRPRLAAADSMGAGISRLLIDQ